LLLALAEHLDVPLGERNEWLLAAGYAPRYPRSALDAPALARVRAGLHRILDAHDPFPAVVVDRCWDIQLSNASALLLAAGLPGHVTGPVPSLFRIALHPDGFAGRSRNFADWSPYLLRNLERTLVRHGSPALRQLAKEAEGWPGVPPRSTWSHEHARDPARYHPGRTGDRDVLPGRRRHRGSPALTRADSITDPANQGDWTVSPWLAGRRRRRMRMRVTG
jgi:MmyB-like transcription regulator ligand binding domain